MNLQENIAYSNEYKQLREEAMSILDEDYFLAESQTILSNGDIVIIRNYENVSNNYHRCGSRFFLKRHDSVVYNFDMPIYYGRLLSNKIIEHINGNSYILFSTELYGYSVLNLKTLEVKHYIPKNVLANEESFIWVQAEYCKNNNLLYVSGCYWAAPSGILIVDFSAPEALPFLEFDLSNIFGDLCTDIDPVRWNSDGSFVCEIDSKQYVLTNEKVLSFVRDGKTK